MRTKVKVTKFTLKLISLLASILIWIFVLNAERVKVEKVIQVDYILPEDVIFSQKIPREITVELEGPRAFVRSFLSQDKAIILNLSKQIDLKKNKFTIRYGQEILDLPIGLDIKKVIPEKIQIEVEPRIIKNIPISLNLIGYDPKKVKFRKRKLDPEEISVSGPRSVIDSIESIKTNPIYFENLFGLNNIPLELSLPDDRLKINGKSDFQFLFEFDIQGPNLILKNIPIQIFTQNENIFFPDQFASIELFIPDKMKFNKDLSSRVQIVAEIPNNKHGKIEVPLKAILPKDFYQIRLIPQTIIVDLP